VHQTSVNPIKVTPALREEIAKRLDDPAASEKRARVLSVEDDDSTYFMNSSVLNAIGPELGRQRAEDGEHALARLKRARGNFPDAKGDQQDR
jgi:hypothetical protein